MIAPKIVARWPNVKVNDLNETFLSSYKDVAWCYAGGARNIRKQNSWAGFSRITFKGSNGYGITEYSSGRSRLANTIPNLKISARQRLQCRRGIRRTRDGARDDRPSRRPVDPRRDAAGRGWP